MNGKRVMVAGLLAGVVAVPGAMAHEAGDFLLRFGPAPVMPHDDSSLIRANGTPVAGTGVEVRDATQLGITAAYMLTDSLAIELLASTPFKHEIRAKGLGGLDIRDVGEATHLPPTLSLTWFPDTPWAKVHPYVGVGVNYTLFFSEDVDSSFEAVLGNSRMELDDSVGLAFEAGVDYQVGENWFLNLSVWHMDIDTEATIRTPTAGFERITVDVDIDPIAYVAGVTLRF